MSPVVVGGVIATIVIWDAWCGGRIARLAAVSRPQRAMAGIVALLALPGAVLALAGGSLEMAHAVREAIWLWPIIGVLALCQPLAMRGRDRAGLWLALAAFAWNAIAATDACTRALAGAGLAVPDLIATIAGLPRAMLGGAVGDTALTAPWAFLPPVLVPAWVPRWPVTRWTRAAFAGALSGAVVTMLVLAWPTWAAVSSYARYDDDPMRERTSEDFAVGMRVMGTVLDAPPAGVARADAGAAEALEASALMLTIDAAAERPAVDSLARSVDAAAKNGAAILALLEAPFDQASDDVAVLGATRVARRLHPAVVIVGAAPPSVPFQRWTTRVTRMATAVRSADPAIQIAVAVTAQDSARYAWAAAPGAPLDAILVVITPSRRGAGALDAQRNIFTEWITRFGARRDHWLWDAGGVPAAHGEESQRRAVLGALAWATGQPRVIGAIVGDAGDHGELTGLRAATGGWRPAAGIALRTSKMLREARPAIPPAPVDTMPVDTTAVETTPMPDSVVVPR